MMDNPPHDAQYLQIFSGLDGETNTDINVSPRCWCFDATAAVWRTQPQQQQQQEQQVLYE